MGADARFHRLAATLDYPLYVVTAASGEEVSGCLIGFATQCSIHPPRFLACISKKNHTLPVATASPVLAIHVLDDDDRETAELFGGETGDEVDKFAQVRWHPGPSGVPVLDGHERWFAGAVLDRFDLGDHLGFLLEPIDADQQPAEPQLTYQEAQDIDPGHEP